MYEILYRKQTLKSISKLKEARLDKKVKQLIDIIRDNPYQNPPPYEKLVGELSGAYSRRINNKHRLVYQVIEAEKKVRIISMWSHYENWIKTLISLEKSRLFAY